MLQRYNKNLKYTRKRGIFLENLEKPDRYAVPEMSKSNLDGMDGEGLHPHLARIGQGGIFLSAKMWRMHRENDGRYVITNVITQRDDSDAVICLHRKPRKEEG